ncbi:CZB domain-containing protein [Phenylobacterium kunshanense]|uniref:Chemotaxis protein n=1 Tax=Phenylobacterium kunshanense TaxID=1445034 RepID=A0A328BH19_9CAUL|nr:CZB domain-containing protein [Phenylobacterium kunshanense]RAK64438.1 chemotaxis protein [Phenylobacterium kunshanense]
MNLDSAIAAHTEWKIKLRSAIERCEAVDAATIAADNCCELGRWLQGEGKRAHGASVMFSDLGTKHTAFHRAAGQVAREINARNYDAATQLLGAGTTYAAASSAVGVAISALKREIAKAA